MRWKMAASPAAPVVPAGAAAVRWFGRLQLLRLLGKSDRTMAWRVADPRTGQDLVLVLPRVQPAEAHGLARWQQAAGRANRLHHPRLAVVAECGVQDGWPYVAYEASDLVTLAERMPPGGATAAAAAAYATQVLQGLAYGHEAGISHGDLQPFLVLVDDNDRLCLAGMAVADIPIDAADETDSLRLQRDAAERDVLCLGILLHWLLTGQPALQEADSGRVIARLPPTGRDVLRLPWTTAQPVPAALRAIANRATDRQERQRYRSARTLLRALEGWQRTEGQADAGPLSLLADRLRLAGVLPSAPGAASRAARLAMMESERTNELAAVVLEDLALSFEMLRLVNTAQVRAMQLSGSGPVLTVRRAIAMLGLDGVRRAALALRPWPGPLNEAGAAELHKLLEQCKRAGRVAVALRPVGYDEEVVYLVTLMQNLGRLIVQYHFAEEAAQIRRLTMPSPAAHADDAEEPGMSPESASYAVLGADIEAIGQAVARQWGLDDSMLGLIRGLPRGTPLRSVESDDDILRALAGCANETVEALTLPAKRVGPALHRVVARYGHALGFGARELQAALQGRGAAPAAEPATRAASTLRAAAASAAVPAAKVTSLTPGTGRNA